MAKHQRQPLNRGKDDSSRSRWIVSALTTIVVFAAIVAACGVFFFANDDVGIQNILAGITPPEPEPHAVFVNYVSCLVVSCLFDGFPGVPWWTVYQFFVLFCSGVVTQYCILTVLSTRCFKRSFRCSRLLVAVLSSVILFSLFLFPVCRPQFTMTASYAGSAAILWVYTATGSMTSKRRVVSIALLLLVLGFCTRSICAELCLLFLLMCAVLRCFVCCELPLRLARIRNFVVGSVDFQAVAAAACAFMLLAITHAVAYSSNEWVEFDKVNSSRSSFMDYSHDGFEANSEPYIEAGWDANLATLVSNWYFMDSRVDSDSFESIYVATKHEWNAETSFVVQALGKTGPFSNRTAVAYLGLLCTLLCVLALSSPGWRAILCVLAIVAISFALLLFLDIRGRLIVRSMQSVTIPASFAAASLSLVLSQGAISRKKGIVATDRGALSVRLFAAIGCAASLLLLAVHVFLDRGASFIIVVAPFAILVLCLLVPLPKGRHSERAYGSIVLLLLVVFALQGLSLLPEYSRFSDNYRNYDRSLQRYEDFNDYASSNETTTFVVPAGTFAHNSVCLVPYSDNRLPWGGWEYYAPWSVERRRARGMDESCDAWFFLSENVRLVVQNSSTADLFADYLESVLGIAVSPVLDEVLSSGVGVYSFVSDERSLGNGY